MHVLVYDLFCCVKMYILQKRSCQLYTVPMQLVSSITRVMSMIRVVIRCIKYNFIYSLLSACHVVFCGHSCFLYHYYWDHNLIKIPSFTSSRLLICRGVGDLMKHHNEPHTFDPMLWIFNDMIHVTYDPFQPIALLIANTPV